MIEYLERVAQHLSELGLETAQHLQPPLTRPDLDTVNNGLPFVLSPEVEKLFKWRNGTQAGRGDNLSQRHFMPMFYLLSIEEALEIWKVYRTNEGWRDGWFPILADDAGDFLVAVCKPLEGEGTIVFFDHDEPEKNVEYQSIETMAQTLDAAFAQGVMFLDEDGWLDSDEDRYAAVAREFNPEVTIWKT